MDELDILAKLTPEEREGYWYDKLTCGQAWVKCHEDGRVEYIPLSNILVDPAEQKDT